MGHKADAETDALLAFEMHRMSLEELYKSLETSPEGMVQGVVKQKRASSGDNTIPAPLSAPAWLCCLLPCLLRTKSMEQFKECVALSAQVKRSGRPWVNMEALGILPGDIIKCSEGERVAADIRLIEAKRCAFDTSVITGKKAPIAADETTSVKAYTESPNMAFAGYLCTAGDCVGVVVATGADTVMGKMIARAEWPPKGYA